MEEGHIREGHFAAGVNAIVSVVVHVPCTSSGPGAGPSTGAGTGTSAGSRRVLTFDEVYIESE